MIERVIINRITLKKNMRGPSADEPRDIERGWRKSPEATKLADLPALGGRTT